MTQQRGCEACREALAAHLPAFYEAVAAFPDFYVEKTLDAGTLAAIEQKIDFQLHDDLRELFGICSVIAMNGLKISANELGSILMPGSEGLILGEFYLRSPGDRLLMLPDDPAIYYLEQRNGAITKLAPGVREFFNEVLPNCL